MTFSSVVRKSLSYADVVTNNWQVSELEGEADPNMKISCDYVVLSPKTDHNVDVIPTPPIAFEAATRFSKRNTCGMQEKVEDRARRLASKRDLEGNPQLRNNSFSVLSDAELISRASNMGVIIPDDSFACIDVLRELEQVREELDLKKKTSHEKQEHDMFITNGLGHSTPVSLEWLDQDETIYENESITKSKRKNNRKPTVKISRPVTRSQKKKEENEGGKCNSTMSPGGVTRGKIPQEAFQMRGLIWNCRGVGKKGIATCLTDLIRDHSLDFMVLKKDLSPKCLRRLDPFGLFNWEWIPSRGKSGGVLCGVRHDTLDIISCTKGKYILQMVLDDKRKKIVWGLLVVYGSAHEESKEEFLVELASMCSNMKVPYIVGGDFNILRHSGEKNKSFSICKSTNLFNSVINTLALREIHISGGKYTWTNNQAHPTLEKLDRIVMSETWEDLFPLVSVRKLVREIADHNPLLLSSGEEGRDAPKPREFWFDLSWIKDDKFIPAVSRIWSRLVQSVDPIDILNIKLKRIKTYFKGWGSDKFGRDKKRKEELRNELAHLEELEEEGPLSPELYNKKVDVDFELHELLVNEEIYWLQQSHERWLLKGDMIRVTIII